MNNEFNEHELLQNREKSNQDKSNHEQCHAHVHSGFLVPKKIFLTRGSGVHKDYLQSFEIALRNAGLAPYNLVNVSSIFPPNCKKITKDEGLKELLPGQIVFTVMARNATNEPNRLMSASVGLAIPKDPNQYGYLSEHHTFGETDAKSGDYAEDLAASMLASTLGIDFDENSAWDEKEQIFKLSGQIVRTSNITQSAIGNKDGLWTSVVAVACLVL